MPLAPPTIRPILRLNSASGGHALEFCFFERPVFDAKGFGARQVRRNCESE